MKIRRSRPLDAYVPTASMADIAFLLIIFFMVTTVFDVDKTKLSLPQSDLQEQLEHGAAVVVVAKDEAHPGVLLYRFSNGEEQSRPIRLDELPALVDAALGRFADLRREHLFVIKADAGAPYRAIDAVMELLRDRGASNIFLLTTGRQG